MKTSSKAHLLSEKSKKVQYTKWSVIYKGKSIRQTMGKTECKENLRVLSFEIVFWDIHSRTVCMTFKRGCRREDKIAAVDFLAFSHGWKINQSFFICIHTHGNLQRHRVVLPAIARLSCFTFTLYRRLVSTVVSSMSPRERNIKEDRRRGYQRTIRESGLASLKYIQCTVYPHK